MGKIFSENLSLNGNLYSSNFLANPIRDTRTISGTDHYSGDRQENLFWWEGKGVINNLERGERIFLFKTKEFYQGSVIKTLEEALILFDKTNDWKGIKPKIVDYPSIIDRSLDFMYKDAMPKDNEIIPLITPTVLNFNELVKKGFVADKKGQINLNLD